MSNHFLWAINPTGRFSADDLIPKNGGRTLGSAIANEFWEAVAATPRFAITSGATTRFISDYPKVTIASSSTCSFNGHIKPDARASITSGSTTTFRTNALTSPLATKLLVHAEGSQGSTSFPDETGKLVTGTGAITRGDHAPITGSNACIASGATTLTIPDSTDFQFGSGDFTLEGWFKPVNTPSPIELFVKGTSGYAYDFSLIRATDGSIQFFTSVTGTSADVSITTAAGVMPLDTWKHVALVRYGGVITLYVNGVYLGTGTSTGPNYVTSASIVVSGKGLADELRISNVARYLTAFSGSLPTTTFELEVGATVITATTAIATSSATSFTSSAPWTYERTFAIASASTGNFEGWTWGSPQTVALFHFDGADGGTNIIDENGNPLSNYYHTTSTAVAPKFGSASSYFNTGKALVLDYAPHLLLADTDFTVEMWVYRTSIYSDGAIFSTADPISHRPAVMMFINGYGIAGNETLRIDIGKDRFTTLEAETSAGFLPVGSWHHIALCREAGVISAYINGTRRASITFFPFGANMLNTDISVYPSPIYIGQDGNGVEVNATYIDEFRITRRASQYPNGATITVPTAPFGQNGPTFRKLSLTGGSVTNFNGGFVEASPTATSISAGSTTALAARPSQRFSLTSGSTASLVGNSEINGSAFAISSGSVCAFASPNAGGVRYASFDIDCASAITVVPRFNSPAASSITGASRTNLLSFRLACRAAQANIVSGSALSLPAAARVAAAAALFSGSATTCFGRSSAQAKYTVQGASAPGFSGRFGSGGGFTINGMSVTFFAGGADYQPTIFAPDDQSSVFVRSRPARTYIRTKTPSSFIRGQ